MQQLELNQLTYRYDLRSPGGVNDINLNLPGQKSIAIMGPSGSGKSTLLKLIARKIIPQKGSITTSYAENEIYYLQQEETLPLEIKVNDYLGKDFAQSFTRELLEDFELTNEVEKKIEQLSLGQRQRLRLIKGLLAPAKILLMDEPLSHLDGPMRVEVLEKIVKLTQKRGQTLLWVSHHQSEGLSFSDYILFLQWGYLQQFASPREIYFRPQNIFVAQFFGPGNFFRTSGGQLGFCRPEELKFIEGEQWKTVSSYFEGHRTLWKLSKNEQIAWVSSEENISPSVNIIYPNSPHIIPE